MNHIDVINHIDVSHETKYKYFALRASQNKVIINLLDQFYVRILWQDFFIYVMSYAIFNYYNYI